MNLPSRLGLPLLALAVIALLYLVWGTDLLTRFDRVAIGETVVEVGVWGPALIVVLMIIAVVASPLPSAPIALAAGAAYGHFAGTVYVAIGAELGAMIAFLIARCLGRGAVVRLLGDKADFGLLGSQNVLTMIVFTSRLLPFVSFDAMSYAAGLSKLHLWRFLLATFAGIIPASFLLAHFGSEVMSGEFSEVEWLVLGLGFLTAMPILLVALKRGKSDDGKQ